MSNPDVQDKPHPGGVRWSLILGFGMPTGIILVAIALGVRHWRSAPRAGEGLIVEPNAAELFDRTYGEGEQVKSRFRIRNPLAKPVTVQSIATSCACIATEVEGGAPPPFVIRPHGSAEFWLKASTLATQEPVQEFHASVASDCGGRPLPDAVVSLRFRVEDPVRAYPPSIIVGDAPADRPIQRRLVLATRLAASSVPPLEVSASPSDLVHAELAKGPEMDDLNVPGFKTRCVVDATVSPRRGGPATCGGIKVMSQGRLLAYIPVECTFKQDYRLSQDCIEADGPPGRLVTKELYYEPHVGEWRGVRVVSAPAGVDVKIEPFDATADVIRTKIRIPGPGARDSGARTGEIVLATADGRHEIRIPVKYRRTSVHVR